MAGQPEAAAVSIAEEIFRVIQSSGEPVGADELATHLSSFVPPLLMTDRRPTNGDARSMLPDLARAIRLEQSPERRYKLILGFWVLFYSSAGSSRSTFDVSSVDVAAAMLRTIYGSQPSDDGSVDSMLARVAPSEASPEELEAWKLGHALSVVSPLEGAPLGNYRAIQSLVGTIAREAINYRTRWIREGSADAERVHGDTSPMPDFAAELVTRSATVDPEMLRDDERLAAASLIAYMAALYASRGDEAIDELDNIARDLEQVAKELSAEAEISDVELDRVLRSIKHPRRRELIRRLVETDIEAAKRVAGGIAEVERIQASLRARARKLFEFADDLKAALRKAAEEAEEDWPRESPMMPEREVVLEPWCVIDAIREANRQIEQKIEALERIIQSPEFALPGGGRARQIASAKLARLKSMLESNRQKMRQLRQKANRDMTEWIEDPGEFVEFNTVNGRLSIPVYYSSLLDVEIAAELAAPQLPTEEQALHLTTDDEREIERLREATNVVAKEISDAGPKAVEKALRDRIMLFMKALQSSAATNVDLWRHIALIEAVLPDSADWRGAPVGDQERLEQMAMEAVQASGLYHYLAKQKWRLPYSRLHEIPPFEGQREVARFEGPAFSEVAKRFVRYATREIAARGIKTPENPDGVPVDLITNWWRWIGEPVMRLQGSQLDVFDDEEAQRELWHFPKEESSKLRYHSEGPEPLWVFAEEDVEGKRYQINIDSMTDPVACDVGAVIDGDTVRVLVPARVTIRDQQGRMREEIACLRVNLRLQGINAAELSAPDGVGRLVARYLDELVKASVDTAFRLDEIEPIQTAGRGAGKRAIGSLFIEVPKSAVQGLSPESIISETDETYVIDFQRELQQLGRQAAKSAAVRKVGEQEFRFEGMGVVKTFGAGPKPVDEKKVLEAIVPGPRRRVDVEGPEEALRGTGEAPITVLPAERAEKE